MRLGKTSDQQYIEWRSEINARQVWRKVFALFPRRLLSGEYIWLEWVEVRGYRGQTITGWYWIYRPLGSNQDLPYY